MKIAAYLFCLAAGAFLARFELRTDDAGVEVFLILLATFLLGCIHPRHAWRWALLVGPWVPGAQFFFGSGAQSLSSLGLLLGFVIAVGLAGSYAGALLRKAVSVVRQAG